MIGRTSELLRSKLRAPTVPDHFVPRDRLIERLATVGERPLTLIVAPAGSGKTQLMASWVTMQRMPTAWLALEEADDDPVEFWSGVVAALDPFAPGCGADLDGRSRGRRRIDEIVASVLNELDSVQARPSVLVIDDAHLLRDAETTATLGLFVQHLPAWLHVVLLSRSDPRLPLDRLRGRGQIAELRFADLRFTPGEARSMLARLAPMLTDDELDESVRHTDGWAAGLQLTALAARSTDVRRSSAPMRSDVRLLTEDYVWHEVLAAGNQDVIDALLEISIVDRVNAALAAAITGRPDIRPLLAQAEAQGLFVYRLGADGWFQIHALVREVLLNELIRQGRHRDLHARAARWFETEDEVTEALGQWMLADRPREALRVLGAHSTHLYNQGREAVIERTIAAIPPDVAADDMPALIDYSVCQVLISRPRFIDAVREATAHAARSDSDFGPQIAALRSMSATMLGDWTSGGAWSLAALDGLGDAWSHDVAGRFAWNIVGRSVALSERWDDEDPEVSAASLHMVREPGRGLTFEGIRALGYALAGRPIDALRISAGIRHAASTMSILRSELELADAIARREIGDRERALDELRAMSDQVDEPRLYVPVIATLELALDAVEAGRPEDAAERVRAAQSLLEEHGAGTDLRDWADRATVSVAITLGDDEEARRRATCVRDPFWGPVSRARVDLAFGDRSSAMQELDRAQARCARHRVVLELARGSAADSPSEIDQHVTTAVRLAATNGLVQTVVANGRAVMDAIERAAWAASDEWMHRVRIAMATARSDLPVGGPATLEPLTARERDVLRLLPSRLTLNEIARELYVSVNTLKFHLRVIYRKLGVNSRDEAAAVSRSMTMVASKPSR